MRAAIYARRSHPQPGVPPDATSVQRQLDQGRAYAGRRGWTVDDAHCYADEGISGAEFVRRPGLLRLLAALRPRPPFQVLVMAEEFRLGREQIETAYVLKQIIDAGVRVFFYLEDRERTLETPLDKVMLSLMHFAGELEREKGRQRTYAALRGKAEAGQVTGGRVYGYDNVAILGPPGPDGTRRRVHVLRRVNPDQAAVVRRIFEGCAAGLGLGRLAKALNAEHVPPPRAGRHGWCPSAIRAILHRPLYRGEIVWNQRQTITRGGRTKLRRRRPASEWLRRAAPELGIIPEALWQSAQAALGRRWRIYAAPRAAGPRPPGERPATTLLSGLARCAWCGGSIVGLTRASGSTRQRHYGCSYHWKRGTAVCRNRVLVPQAVVDRILLRALARALDDRRIAAAIDEALAELRRAEPDQVDRRAAIMRELSLIEARTRRLAEAIAQGDALAPVLEALRREEARKAALIAELATVTAARPITALSPRAWRARLAASAATLRARLGAHPAEAREGLQSVLVDRVTCTPVEQRGRWGFRIDGLGSYAPLVMAGPLPPPVVSPTGFTRWWQARRFPIRALALAA